MKKFIIIIALAAAAGGTAACLGAWYLRSARAGSAAAPAVRVEKPSVGDLVEVVNAAGEVGPLTEVAISARVPARIVEMPYEEGAAVTKGDPAADPPVAASVLVRLDSGDLQASLTSAQARRDAQASQIEMEKSLIAARRADMDGIDFQIVVAGKEFERDSELVKSSGTSQAAFDQTRSRYEQLKSQRLAAEHSLAAAEMNIQVMTHNLAAADADIARAKDAVGYATISSPIDGIVTRRNAKVGELVMTGTMNNPGTVIMKVADLSKMVLMVQVDESDIGGVQVGQRANIRIHAYPGEVFHGAVDSIALTNDIGAGGAKYYRTRIVLDASDQRIYSGLSADVDIETTKHSGVLMVASQAVLPRKVDDLPPAIRENNPDVDMKKTFATVVYRFIDGKAVVTPVTVGASDSTRTIILSGATAADRVITGPYKILDTLSHGQALRDEREAAKDANAAPAPAAPAAPAPAAPDGEGHNGSGGRRGRGGEPLR